MCPPGRSTYELSQARGGKHIIGRKAVLDRSQNVSRKYTPTDARGTERKEGGGNKRKRAQHEQGQFFPMHGANSYEALEIIRQDDYETPDLAVVTDDEELSKMLLQPNLLPENGAFEVDSYFFHPPNNTSDTIFGRDMKKVRSESNDPLHFVPSIICESDCSASSPPTITARVKENMSEKNGDTTKEGKDGKSVKHVLTFDERWEGDEVMMEECYRVLIEMDC